MEELLPLTNVPLSLIINIATQLHTEFIQNIKIPKEVETTFVKVKRSCFKPMTEDECSYVDLKLEKLITIRLLTQNKNKRYTVKDKPVRDGRIRAKQLKPTALLAQSGGQLTWVIEREHCWRFIEHGPPTELVQTTRGVVFNGKWIPYKEWKNTYVAFENEYLNTLS